MSEPTLFKPTGEGDYRMRDGKKANIYAFAWHRWCGKTDDCELDEFQMWRRSGSYDDHCTPIREHSADIVGPWKATP